LKVEDIGLFDPSASITFLPEASTVEGKYTIHRDVFSFTDALRQWPEAAKNLFWKKCLRGAALN